MPITSGSSAKLNTVHGLSSVMVTTSAEETALATKILPAGILVKKSDGKIYLTDGVSTLANLPVLIDSVLTTVEKSFLFSAVDNGSYARAAGGIVVHNSNGKINDDSLNIVTSGKITESYLSDYIDPVTHKVLLSALPDTVRAGVTYVADITARDALSTEQKKSLAFVIDATDDETVDVGSAMYGWDATANNNEGEWIKIAEVESLDIDVAAIRCDYTNTEAAGAVMYDHPIHLHLSTATDFINLAEAAEEPSEVVDTVHDETQDYSEMGWGNFISSLNTATNVSSADIYMAADDDDIVTINIVSDSLNLGATTFSIVDNTTNDNVTLPITAVVPNAENTAVLAISTARTEIAAVANNQNDHPVTLVITDGTYTYRNTTYDHASSIGYGFFTNGNTINLDNDSDWVSDN